VVRAAFVFAVLAAALSVFAVAVAAANQGLQSSVGNGLILVGSQIASIAATLLFLFAGHGLLALAYGAVARSAVLAVCSGGYLIRRMAREAIGVRSTRAVLRRLLQTLSHTFVSRTVNVVARNAESLIVARSLGVDIVPVLALTRRAPDFSRLLLERPALAMGPAVAHLHGSGDTTRVADVLVRFLRMQFWTTGLAVGGVLALNRPFVGLWVGPGFYAGGTVNVLVALGSGLFVATNVLSALSVSLGEFVLTSRVATAQAACTILFMLGGVAWWGMTGLVAGSAAGTLVTAAWYLPPLLDRQAGFTPVMRRSMWLEAAAIVGALGSASAIASFIPVPDWKAFGLAIAAYAVVYAIVLAMLSPGLRSELRHVRHARRSALPVAPNAPESR
jgi:O-antigen/teichoic acid export membrane protein